MPYLPERQNTAAEVDVQRFLKPGETMEALFARSVREVQKWRKRRRWTLGISWGFLFFATIGVLLMPRLGLGEASPVFMFLAIVGAMLGLLAGMLLRPTKRNALNCLLQTDDVRAVGPLLEVTQIMIPDLAAKAGQGLIRLLPRLDEEHATLLTPLHRRYLRSLIADDAPGRADNPGKSGVVGAVNTLNLLPSFVFDAASWFAASKIFGYRSEALSVAVVQALARIGDDKDLELIRHIAANSVQQAALQAQEQLGKRVRNLQERQTHLRGASVPTVSPEELVYAVHSSPASSEAATIETAILVRPTQEESQTQSISS